MGKNMANSIDKSMKRAFTKLEALAFLKRTGQEGRLAELKKSNPTRTEEQLLEAAYRIKLVKKK